MIGVQMFSPQAIELYPLAQIHVSETVAIGIYIISSLVAIVGAIIGIRDIAMGFRMDSTLGEGFLSIGLMVLGWFGFFAIDLHHKDRLGALLFDAPAVELGIVKAVGVEPTGVLSSPVIHVEIADGASLSLEGSAELHVGDKLGMKKAEGETRYLVLGGALYGYVRPNYFVATEPQPTRDAREAPAAK